MASITISGTLTLPTSGLAAGDKIRFTHQSTTGETLFGSVSSDFIIPVDGTYSFELQFGLIKISTWTFRDSKWVDQGIVTINDDQTATTLPELLNSTIPNTTPTSLHYALGSAGNPLYPSPIELFFLRGAPGGVDVEWIDLADSGLPVNANFVTYSAGNNFTGGVDRTQEDKNLDGVSSGDFGMVGDNIADDTVDLNQYIQYSNNDGFHKKTSISSGRYKITNTITIDSSTDASDTTSHRNFLLDGEGGMTTETSTEIRFDVNDAGKNGLEINSTFGARVSSIALTSDTVNNSILTVDADDSPAFSGSLNTFDGCYFNSFSFTPTNAVIAILNQKNTRIDDSWLGVRVAGDVCLELGGNVAANASKLQLGELDCFGLTNNFIFGEVQVKNLIGFNIDNNTFVESFDSRIAPGGDGGMMCGIIQNNYFTGVTGGTETATAITTGFKNAAGGEDSGCINIDRNRIRFRPIGINIQNKGPHSLENNYFRPDPGENNIGIQIQADAENVTIKAQDFSDMFLDSGAIGISDLRHTFGTDQPTHNVDKDIVADFVLSAADTAISGNNTTQLIGSVTAKHLRGGKYRIRCEVSVRNTQAASPLPFQIFLKYRDETNVLHDIGITSAGYVGDADDHIINTANVSTFVERIVYLPATTLNTPTLSSFELYVKNNSPITSSGFVNGNATELTGAEATWFQVEEYRD